MRGRSIVEVLAVFSSFQLIIIFLPGVLGLVRWEQRVLGWSYFTGFLLVLLPTLVMVLQKREFELYGLTLRRWETSLDEVEVPLQSHVKAGLPSPKRQAVEF